MREAITIGHKPGSKAPDVILGPEVSVVEHQANARKMTVSEDNPYELIEVWTSDRGIVKTVKNPGAKLEESETVDEPKRRGRPPKTLP